MRRCTSARTGEPRPGLRQAGGVNARACQQPTWEPNAPRTARARTTSARAWQCADGTALVHRGRPRPGRWTPIGRCVARHLVQPRTRLRRQPVPRCRAGDDWGWGHPRQDRRALPTVYARHTTVRTALARGRRLVSRPGRVRVPDGHIVLRSSPHACVRAGPEKRPHWTFNPKSEHTRLPGPCSWPDRPPSLWRCRLASPR